MSGGGIPCSFCDGKNAANVLMTWLDSGATFSVCPEDFAPAVINVLAVDLGVDPTSFYDSIRRFVAKAAKAEAAGQEKGTPEAEAETPTEGTGEPTADDDDDTTGAELAVAEVISADDATGVQR